MEPRARIGFLAGALFLVALAVVTLPSAGEVKRPRTHTVVIEAMAFTPTELRVGPGERVLFQNKDLLPHTATARDPKGFDSGLIKAGDAWTLQLGSDPQTIHYRCVYHPTMEGRIIVSRLSE